MGGHEHHEMGLAWWESNWNAPARLTVAVKVFLAPTACWLLARRPLFAADPAVWRIIDWETFPFDGNGGRWSCPDQPGSWIMGVSLPMSLGSPMGGII